MTIECPHCNAKNELPSSIESATTFRCAVCEKLDLYTPEKSKFNSYFPNCIEKISPHGVRYIAEAHILIEEPGHEDRYVVIPGGVPPHPSQIEGWKLPIEDQMWRKPAVMPEWTDGYLRKMSSRFIKANKKYDDRWWDNVDLYNSDPEKFNGIPFEAMHEWAERENDRRSNGYWFMNKGVAIKLTGEHYYYLVTGVQDENVPTDFRFIDWLHEWWDLQEVVNDYDCLGAIMPKHRRGGFTTRHGSKGLCRISQLSNAQMGIVSKKDSDAKQAFRRIVRQLNKGVYPFWRPIRSGKEIAEKEILFRKPSLTMSRGIAHIEEDDDEGLDSRVSYEATVEHAYDSQQLQVALLDEMGKIEKDRIDPNKLWDVIKETLRVGLRVVGKAYMLSTVEELTLKGGEKFQELCSSSRLDTINSTTGRTRSGLKRFFVPADWGLEGFIDQYGIPKCDPLTAADIKSLHKMPANERFRYRIGVGASKYLDEEHEQQKRAGKGSLHRRKYPRTYMDCFIADGIGCVFGNPEDIADRLLYLGATNKKDIWKTGDLRWKHGRFTEVEFIEKENGLWRVMRELPPGVDAGLNAVVSRGGFKGSTFEPMNGGKIVLGLDPYDHVGELNKDRSRAALYAFRKHDSAIDTPHTIIEQRKTNIHFLEYLHRRNNPKQMYEDVLLTCWWLGAPILPETNKPGFYNWMREIGCWEFLYHKPNSMLATDAAKTQKRETDDRGFYNTANSQTSVNDTITEQWDLYLYENVHRIVFPELLDQLLRWNPREATKFDSVIGAGACLLAVGTHIETKRTVDFSINYDDFALSEY